MGGSPGLRVLCAPNAFRGPSPRRPRRRRWRPGARDAGGPGPGFAHGGRRRRHLGRPSRVSPAARIELTGSPARWAAGWWPAWHGSPRPPRSSSWPRPPACGASRVSPRRPARTPGGAGELIARALAGTPAASWWASAARPAPTGAGLLTALGVKLLDGVATPSAPAGAPSPRWNPPTSLTWDPRLRLCRLEVVSDVDSPLLRQARRSPRLRAPERATGPEVDRLAAGCGGSRGAGA